MKIALTVLISLSASLAAGAVATASPPASPDTTSQAPAVTLAAFECGELMQDLARFNDAFRVKREERKLIAGCYLIRHPKGILLWDTGLDPALIGAPAEAAPGISVSTRISQRLNALGLKPADVRYVGISHYHADHTGGLVEFPHAELLIGAREWEAVKAMENNRDKRQLAHWITGPGKVRPLPGDLDLFGDGSVVMLQMPGHTEGHSALLVRLPKSGAVLISGDQYHFRENRELAGVPTFNFDRAQTLASHARFEEIAKTLEARVVIQHDSRDMAELPAFPMVLE